MKHWRIKHFKEGDREFQRAYDKWLNRLNFTLFNTLEIEHYNFKFSILK